MSGAANVSRPMFLRGAYVVPLLAVLTLGFFSVLGSHMPGVELALRLLAWLVPLGLILVVAEFVGRAWSWLRGSGR